MRSLAVLAMLCALTGCAMTPQQWQQVSGAVQQMGQQAQQTGHDALQDSPKTTNCVRTYTGMSCTTY